MDAKVLFKKLVKDAMERTHCVPSRIMSYGSQCPFDFEAGKKRKGRFAHLTDEFIDALDDEKLEREMVTFIYKCFQQR